MDKRVYWEIVQVPYQHGPHKHRLFLLDLLAEKEVKSLLDIGCGTGPIYDLLINGEEGRWDTIIKYKGVDYAPNFIAWAQNEYGNKLFELGDARKLKETDNSWDCVLLMHSLDHIKQYQDVIAEAARVTKKYVVIILWQDFRLDGEVKVNDRNTFGKPKDENGQLLEGEEPWEDTYLMQYAREKLEEEFKKNNLHLVEEAGGDLLNSDQSKFNYLFLLEKI